VATVRGGVCADELDHLDEWLADARADEAASARVRERWLGQQAGEQARFDLVLSDAAARGLRVRVHTAHGAHAGRLIEVGHDFVALRTARDADVLVATGVVTAVEVAAGTALGGGRELDPADEDEAGSGGRLADRLADAAAERPRVELRVSGGEVLVGDLLGAGVDVVTVRTGSPAADCYVPLASVSDVTFRGSG